MQYDSLPKELRDNGVFCLWKYEERKGQVKPAKVPYQVSGKRAQSNNKCTFSDYSDAVAVVSRYDGLGLGIFRGFSAVDVDHCANADGTLTATGQAIVDIFTNCYIEKSPSGTGLRILFKVTGFKYEVAKYYINNSKLGVEVYVYGATKKYVTVTGNVYQQGDVLEAAPQLQTLLDTFMLRTVKPSEAYSAEEQSAETASFLSDESVIEKAKAAKNGAAFTKLWEGDISGYPSQSEADLALCSNLAFWCGRDTVQMDRLFRRCGLYRDKWDRPQSGSTYGQITLEKAASLCSSVYQPVLHADANEDFGIIAPKLADLKPDSNRRYGWSDNGAGRLFADVFKPYARYVPERKVWYVYDGNRWVTDMAALKVMELCKDLSDALMTYALSIHDEHKRKDYIKYCAKWQIRGVRITVLSDAQSVYPISMEKFDTDRYLFNCNNGTLDLRTMQFRDHSPEDRLTKIAPVKYDPNAVCPRFTSFIDEIMSGDKEKAKFLQKALGYAVSGDTRFECMFFLYGETTRNGKGTLMESILRVFGDYGKAVRPETIALKQYNNSSNPSEDVARLAGVRFANISEPSRGLLLNAAQVKSMTGNDTLNARFLHENSFDFTPQFKLYVNTNYLPVINDMTLFTSGRVLIVPFDKHFEEWEQDKTLKAEFSKLEMQSAILNWLLQGYIMLREEGFTMPQSVIDATNEYSHDSNKIQLFADECLEERGDADVKTAETYAAYREWCAVNGCYPESNRNFNQALRSFGTVIRKRPADGGEKTTLPIGYSLKKVFL
ncbi:MAG TPA: nucleoside triphosphatase [Bacillales bacterium]|nr:nucleoside triphosphatase [Bacillales bacterium]